MRKTASWHGIVTSHWMASIFLCESLPKKLAKGTISVMGLLKMRLEEPLNQGALTFRFLNVLLLIAMKEDWRTLELQASQFKVHGELAKAIERYDKAISIALESDPVHAGLMLNSVADLHLKLSQFALAEASARRSIAIEMEFGNTEKDTLASYYIMLARALEKQNRHGEALECVEKALPIYERVLEPVINF